MHGHLDPFNFNSSVHSRKPTAAQRTLHVGCCAIRGHQRADVHAVHVADWMGGW